MARKIAPFQLRRDSAAVATYGPSNDVLEFGPRYSPPLDNTMVVNIFHATLDGGVSVLMDHEDVTALLEWLAENPLDTWRGSISYRCTQTTAEFVRRAHPVTGDELVDVRIWWHGSKRARSYVLTHGQTEELVTFLRRALEEGWEGWLAPADVAPALHGHVAVNGVQAPCKLCELRAAKARRV